MLGSLTKFDDRVVRLLVAALVASGCGGVRGQRGQRRIARGAVPGKSGKFGNSIVSGSRQTVRGADRRAR